MQTSARGRPAINAGYHQAREGVFLNSLLDGETEAAPRIREAAMRIVLSVFLCLCGLFSIARAGGRENKAGEGSD